MCQAKNPVGVKITPTTEAVIAVSGAVQQPADVNGELDRLRTGVAPRAVW